MTTKAGSRMLRARTLAVLGMGITASALAGCPNDYTCADYLACTPDSGAEASTPTEAGADARHDVATGSDAGHDGSLDGTVSDASNPDVVTPADAPPDSPVDSFVCDPNKPPSAEPCVISEAYGVFVAPAASGGSDSNTGTRTSPFATIAHALANAAGKRVYACGGTYPESVVVGKSLDGAQIYGGLTCPGDAGGGWAYSATAIAAVTPTATGYALDVESLTTGAHFEDVSFTSQDANTAHAGESSIAVMVNASTGVSFTRVEVKAGKGTAGSAGGAAPDQWCSAGAAPAGQASTTVSGGLSGVCSCKVTTTDNSSGGLGGNAGGTGGDGQSTPTVTGMLSPGDGHGGTGSAIAGGCQNGFPGANGEPSSSVPAAAGAGGVLSQTGWLPGGNGGTGAAGNPGRGGGGGGGTGTVVLGSGGAGGGAGGCGGGGGAGGAGGGASIAVAVVNSTVGFATSTLFAGTAGAGGMGAVGEAGQSGGVGGFGASQCSGGTGGAGAGGSGGGGGAGGPSVGIAYTGSASITIDGTATTTTATLPGPTTFSSGGGGLAGSGGGAGPAATGGNAGNAGQDGPPGSSSAVQSF